MAYDVKRPATQDLSTFQAMTSGVVKETKKAIVGKDALINDIFVALLSGGNILLEGIPGVAKTTIAKTFAIATGLDFKRVQFVPDLLPSDILGANIYRQKDSTFEFHPGPIFTNILLVDEVNRASPKIQSSLLEAMEEKQVTIEGKSYQLPAPFMVITTQNPKEIMGTFPLPESQIDRFMFKLIVDYPTSDEELGILKIKNNGGHSVASTVLRREDIVAMMGIVDNVYVDEKVMSYIRNIVLASRAHEKVLIGGSPRASISLLKASKAYAALQGREYVIPDDIKYLLPKVLEHRLIVRPEYELENVTPLDIIKELLGSIEVPT
jgi:MoxR-like ATPase